MKHTRRTLDIPLLTSATLAAAVAVVLVPGTLAAQSAANATARFDAAADTQSALQAPASEEYRLGSGDKLRIEVYKDPQASLESVQVRPDGKITMPLIGDIDAAGRTPADLRDAVTRSLTEYVNNPVVTVIVLEATASTAYVIGGVNHSGVVPLQGNMTVLQALAIAGGLKDFADAKNIRILRKGPAGVKTITFNYKDAIKGSGANPYLRPGDIVVVPD